MLQTELPTPEQTSYAVTVAHETPNSIATALHYWKKVRSPVVGATVDNHISNFYHFPWPCIRMHNKQCTTYLFSNNNYILQIHKQINK